MRRIILVVVMALIMPQALAAQARAAIQPLTRVTSMGVLPPAADAAGSLSRAQQWNAATAAAIDRSTVTAAGIGFVLGAGATWLVLHSGGSTALCDRDANQDAMNAGECVGLTVLGGAVGAGLGVLVARWL